MHPRSQMLFMMLSGTLQWYTMQHLTPKLLPFLTFQFPLITKLKFSSGKNKVITHHQDEWTYDGAIMNIPVFGSFFLGTGRRMVGHFWAWVGSMLMQ